MVLVNFIIRWDNDQKKLTSPKKLTPEKKMACLHLKQGCSLFSWGRARDTGRLDPAEKSSRSRGSSRHLEDGKLGFKARPEIEKSWLTQSLLTTLSGSVYLNSPGWEKGPDFFLAMTALQWGTLVQSYTLNPAGTSHLLLFHMEATAELF